MGYTLSDFFFFGGGGVKAAGVHCSSEVVNKSALFLSTLSIQILLLKLIDVISHSHLHHKGCSILAQHLLTVAVEISLNPHICRWDLSLEHVSLFYRLGCLCTDDRKKEFDCCDLLSTKLALHRAIIHKLIHQNDDHCIRGIPLHPRLTKLCRS